VYCDEAGTPLFRVVKRPGENGKGQDLSAEGRRARRLAQPARGDARRSSAAVSPR
jgi:hypothetical protein